MPDYLKTFAFHGVELDVKPNQQAVGDCPFCDKEKHFYVNANQDSEKHGCWDCKRCGESGNIYTFLQKLYDNALRTTTASQRRELSHHRNAKSNAIGAGVRSTAYQELAYSRERRAWFLPVRNAKGALVNLLVYDPQAEKGYACPTAELPSYPIHFDKSLETATTIFVCEGPWDAYALQSLHRLTPDSRKEGELVAIGLLGATNQSALMERLVSLRKDQQLVLCFDNDKAGQQAFNKMVKSLQEQSVACDVQSVVWHPNLAAGYDLSNFITSKQEKTWIIYKDLCDLFVPVELNRKKHVPITSRDLPEVECQNFADVLAILESTGVELNDRLKDAMAVSIAAIVSSQYSGDPLWLFLVGPSSSGKSLILETTIESDYAIYETTFSYRSLVSGFDTRDPENDPSLMARLTKDGSRCLVVKDYTGVLTQPKQELDELYGLLRDAYDGLVIRKYGNNVARSYEGYFSILAGVTSEIHSLAHSYLGERFLKYEICERTNLLDDKATLAAMRAGQNAVVEHENKRKRQAAVAALIKRILSCAGKELPPITPEQETRIVAMAKLVAICRSVVRRDSDRVPLYTPSPESAARVAKQLARLAQCLCLLHNEPAITDEIMTLVNYVAWDSAYGRKREALGLFQEQAEITVQELADHAEIPPVAAHHTLHDLYDLKLVIRRATSTGKKNSRQFVYRPIKPVQTLLELTNCRRSQDF
jgi:ribosomal protein L37AE/L43A/5S rRNA maturation endonuclease (ribonuclease M5)